MAGVSQHDFDLFDSGQCAVLNLAGVRSSESVVPYTLIRPPTSAKVRSQIAVGLGIARIATGILTAAEPKPNRPSRNSIQGTTSETKGA